MRISSKLYNLSFKKRIPLDAIIELTSLCNLKCRHCYFGEFLNKGEFLSFKDLKKLLKELKKKGTIFLTFTGGEPLLHKNFFEISNYARKLNFDLRVFTNGTLIEEEEAKEIKKIGFSSVEVSLYGGEEKTHDFFSNVKGSFKKTIKGIENLRKYDISVWLKVLLMKENFSEVDEIRKIAKNLKIKVRFDPLVSAGYDFDRKPLKYRLSKKEILNFILKQKVKKIREYPECGAGRNIVAIGFKGDVYPCLLLPIKFGNIKEESFSSIWDKMKNFKFDYCDDCKLKRKCFYCPGIAYLEKKTIGEKVEIFCYITHNNLVKI